MATECTMAVDTSAEVDADFPELEDIMDPEIQKILDEADLMEAVRTHALLFIASALGFAKGRKQSQQA